MSGITAGCLLLLAVLPAQAGKFDTDQESLIPGVKFSGLLDLRAYRADRPVSWLRGGTNMLRYGGRDTDGDGRGDKRVFGASVPQASIVLDAEILPDAKIHVQANFTTDSASGTPTVGVIEAYAQLDKSLGKHAFRIRAGGFIPHLSWEHPGPAWSTRWTLTPSAIGSWVSEEVRVLGAELMWEHPVPAGGMARLTGGGFSGGDHIGRLLWFRSWSLHDYQGDLAAEYALLGRRDRPLVELDGRLGFYGRGDLHFFDHAVQLGGGYWTNNADANKGAAGLAPIDNTPFRTNLFHYGGKVEWKRLTLIGQFMKITISSFARTQRDWPAAYGLASYLWGNLRLGARYDRFWVLNWENGFAYTAFAAYDFSLGQQLGAEYIYGSKRPNNLIKPFAQIERLIQLNWRLKFG